MVGCIGVSNTEPNGDTVKEANFGMRPSLSREVIANVKHKLVLAGPKFVCGQQRLFGPAIGIGSDGFQELWPGRFNMPKFDLQTLRRAAMRCVENVRAKPGGHGKISTTKNRWNSEANESECDDLSFINTLLQRGVCEPRLAFPQPFQRFLDLSRRAV